MCRSDVNARRQLLKNNIKPRQERQKSRFELLPEVRERCKKSKKIDARAYENEGSLQINKATVEAHMGREWDVQSIHVNLVTLTGNIDEEDDYFKLAWGSQ